MFVKKALALALLLSASSDAFRSSFVGGKGSQQLQGAPSSSSCLYMKTIAVFGASGLTAAECIYQALEEGDEVVAMSRNIDNVKIPVSRGKGDDAKFPSDAKLTLISGDVTKMSDVKKVFETGKSIDGVIVALVSSMWK